MDAFLPSLLISLLLLPLCLISVLRRKSSHDSKNHLRGSTGTWPVIGETREFISNPEKFLKERQARQSSEVFQTSLYGEKMAVFCGQQGNKFVFTNENKLFKSWLPQSLSHAILPEPRRTSSSAGRLVHAILKPDALKQYVAAMDSLARRNLVRDWSPDSVVKISPWSQRYTFEVACRLFVGEIDPVRMDKLFDSLTLVTEQLYVPPIDFPGTAYRRTVGAGKALQGEVMRIIQERRKEVLKGNEGDLLSKMLMVRDEEGECPTDMEIYHIISGLLVASETASSALTAVVNYLARLPHIYDGVFKEQMEIAKCKGPNELLTWEHIDKMKYSWNVVRESMRLMTPTQGAFRETMTEFTYAGFTVPKGIKAFWTVYSCHKNPIYFPEPEKFDPSRFEGSGPAPYTFVPFGGGPRMCPGKEFAKLELLVCMYNVVTRFKLEKTIPNEEIVFQPSAKPVHGLPVRVRPHTKLSDSSFT